MRGNRCSAGGGSAYVVVHSDVDADYRLELDLAPGIYMVTAAAVDDQGGPYRLTVQ